MKKLYFALTITSSLLLAACNSTEATPEETEMENKQSDNLINTNSINEEGWINFKGEISPSANEMVHTDSIPYISENEYHLNDSAYVSFYNDNEFLETVLHDGEEPLSVEKVEKANNIKISFSNRKLENIELTQE